MTGHTPPAAKHIHRLDRFQHAMPRPRELTRLKRNTAVIFFCFTKQAETFIQRRDSAASTLPAPSGGKICFCSSVFLPPERGRVGHFDFETHCSPPTVPFTFQWHTGSSSAAILQATITSCRLFFAPSFAFVQCEPMLFWLW